MQAIGLPVKRLVLYKHGVGYVERTGIVSNEREIKLSFKKDVMNDLLKSLCVFSKGEGKVSDISYETPEDISKMIEEKAIRVPDTEAMVGLFRQLKGYEVEIETNTEKFKGKVMGTQEPQESTSQVSIQLNKKDEKNTVVIKDENDYIRNIDIEKITAYKILDSEASEDLKFFLDAVTSERKKNVKAVTVFLDGKKAELTISYIMQMPSWRVSYRLAHEDDGTYLQGWGIIDNVLDEDLKDISLSLVAGKPISFIYDLYTPPIVTRPVIREESRAVSAPIELEAQQEALPSDFVKGEEDEMALEKAPGGKAAEKPKRAMKALPEALPEAPPPKPLGQAMQDSTVVQTKTVEMGEFFKYDIAHPVTVKRGQSAMVPIIQAKIDCKKEHVYNKQKMARNPVVTMRVKNPVVTMRVKNNTGLVLERGPIVVLDKSTYVGEAIFPYTVPNGENHIAYSVDMGVIVTDDSKTEYKVKQVYIADTYLMREEYETVKTEYTIENKNKDDIELVIEHPKNSQYELIDTPKPTEETESYYRWCSKVKGKTQTKFTVKMGRTVSYSEYLRDMTMDSLEWFYNEKHINKRTFEFIKEIIDLKSEIEELNRRIEELDEEKSNIYNEQERIRENLSALTKSGKEEALRNKYVAQLEKQENDLAEIESEKKKLEKQIQAIEKKIDAKIKETQTKAWWEKMIAK
ncbi:MAG: hypothetical protein QXT63_02600 [Thermoplasmata archaeon]